MSAFAYRGNRAREYFDFFVGEVRTISQSGEIDLMDVEGLDYSQCGHDQPDNILRVSYSVQFPGEEEEREGTMFLEHKSARPRQPQPIFRILHVLINRNGYDFFFPINNPFLQRNPIASFKKWIEIAMTSPFNTRQARFDAYLQSTEQKIHDFRMTSLMKNPSFKELPKDIQERLSNESRRP